MDIPAGGAGMSEPKYYPILRKRAPKTENPWVWVIEFKRVN